jgi:hypothetical protein
MSKKTKKAALSKVSPKKYIIYGIFDFDTQSLISVGLDLDKIVFEFELEGYDEEKFDVISFKVVVS